jgi:hypothetical protein
VKAKHYSWVAAALFALEAAAVIVHRARGGVYVGYTHGFSVVLDLVVVVVWIGSALAGLIHRSWGALFLMLVGCLVTVSYGFLFTVQSGAIGVPFVLAAGVQLFCVVNAAHGFIEPERERETTRHPPFFEGALQRLHLRHSH